VEAHKVYLDQQSSGKEMVTVVAVIAIVGSFTIYDLGDFTNPDCTCCWTSHNSATVVVYCCRCSQHRFEENGRRNQTYCCKDGQKSV